MVGTVNLVTVGSSTISNQLVAGLIIVRHMKSILEQSLPLRVQGPMKSTHNALHKAFMTSFSGTHPYFWLCLLFIWQNLQDLMYDQIVLHIPFQYIIDIIISLRHEWPCRGNGDTNYQLTSLCHRDTGIISLSFLHSTFVTSIS